MNIILTTSSLGLIILLQNDGYRENFCYNLDCPGFVSTSNTTVPGVPVQSSTYNGIQMEMDINLELVSSI